MKLFPAFLDLTGVPVLVVGGGAVALRRGEALAGAGAQLTVVAPEVQADLAALAEQTWQRPFEPDDVRGMRLVCACTDQPEVNDVVAELGRQAGAWVNHAGHAESGDLQVGALIARGEVSVAIHTGRGLPLLAQVLRERVGAALPEHFPLEDWSAQRDAALRLEGDAREEALDMLRAEIRSWVGAAHG